MKNIFGFLTVVIFSVAASTFVQAEDSDIIATVGKMREIVVSSLPIQSVSDNANRMNKNSALPGTVSPLSSKLVAVSGGNIRSLKQTANGGVIAVTHNNDVSFFDVSGTMVKSTRLFSKAVSDNGEYIAGLAKPDLRGNNSELRLYDSNGSVLWSKNLGLCRECVVCGVSNTGNVVLMNGLFVSMKIIDAHGNEVVVSSMTGVHDFVFSSDGNYVAGVSVASALGKDSSIRSAKFIVADMNGSLVFESMPFMVNFHDLVLSNVVNVNGTNNFLITFISSSIPEHNMAFYFEMDKKSFRELPKAVGKYFLSATLLSSNLLLLQTNNEILFVVPESWQIIAMHKMRSDATFPPIVLGKRVIIPIYSSQTESQLIEFDVDGRMASHTVLPYQDPELHFFAVSHDTIGISTPNGISLVKFWR